MHNFLGIDGKVVRARSSMRVIAIGASNIAGVFGIVGVFVGGVIEGVGDVAYVLEGCRDVHVVHSKRHT